ncbi:ribosome maturation factor RimP [Modestobacter sp. I12A-02628]|uniref:Ribosome maturation factor RimP n=1 Tax=Goekera deserti TaxID=2497753 RepID=A0A7K3WHH3_9ACTN|nr:ribosome maturation factor RimP [Goekera deserti]MPQ97236.1 ribosome maturation factor RimP [Goekera deserti]NDI50254.1 ribosome maturation factor RimP [Goekera deserti]NEL55822.1 ribosome maturation factor RimP [Goekera deserti]
MSASRAGKTPDATVAALTGWIEPIVAAAGFDLEELVVRQAGQRSVVRVAIDSDDGVPLDSIADVSRALSDVLDAAEGDMGRSPYVLEVTSRGVDRPLTLPRHWRRNVGRLVVVATGPGGAGDPLTGRVVSVDDDGVTLAVQRPGGKGRVAKAAGNRTVRWAELGAGQVQVEFSRPAGHRDAGLVVEASPDGTEDAADDEDDDDLDDLDDLDDDLLDPDLLDDERDGHDPADTGDETVPAHDTTHEDHRPTGQRDDASGGAGRPGPDRRRAPRAGRPPRGGRQ